MRIWPHVLAGLVPVVARLALLAWYPAPQPAAQDEFNHLLVADTLLEVRLANPPHPMARHFETLYVLQAPAYASTYPVGIGATLAVGKVLGHPWAGVLLVCFLAGCALSWFLSAFMPVPWAAAAAAAVGVRWFTRSYWGNSYWGGALAALAGAVFFGALLRWRKTPSARMGLLCGCGWAVAWLVRPWESLGMLAAAAVLLWRPDWRAFARKLVAPALVPLCLAGGLTLLHNRAVTGTALLLPYQFAQRTLGIHQGFLFQRPIAPSLPLADNPRKASETQRSLLEDFRTPSGFLYFASIKLITNTLFYFGLAGLLVIAAGVLKGGDRGMRLAFGGCAAGLAINSVHVGYYPHYIAAFTCFAALALAVAARRVAQMRGGIFAVATIAVFFACFDSLGPSPGLESVGKPTARELARQKIAAEPGAHLVLVPYAPNHDFKDEWIENEAAIDKARIVWALSLGPEEDKRLLAHFPGRRVWVVEPDSPGAQPRLWKRPTE